MEPHQMAVESPRLAGKRVLITGTGRGQGAAAQELFCRHGATVVGCDVIEGAAEQSAAQLQEAGLAASGVTVDLTDMDAARAWVTQGVEEMGGLDVLYNNAGASKFASFADMAPDQWHFTIVHELDILFYVTSPAWAHLTGGGGSIINTASVSALLGSEMNGTAAHSAAKGGVLGLTKQLAVEGAKHKVRVNAISPGFVDTPVTSTVPPDVKRRITEMHPLGRVATGQDIAHCALFLASDESSFITGVEFLVDGGFSSV
jgi:meso-butanediol dehydrogenase/(S,S)-butanediol dehydrogenase/diacetyl reductase